MNGSTPTVTGNSTTAETAALSGLAPNTEYFFQIEAIQQRRHHHLGSVLNFTTTLSPDRHHQRGQRHHGHRLDPQRLGQRRELVDHGQLLLQHLELADELHGRTAPR